MLADIRRYLIAVAHDTAQRLCHLHGTTTSTRVLRDMRAKGWGRSMDAVDPRWIGAVLLPSRGFERTGAIERTGSKGRPVTVWRIARRNTVEAP